MESNFKHHLLFNKLIDNTITPNDFGKIMAPFYFAVYNWPIILKKFSKLLKFTKVSMVKSIDNKLIDNINDEYGIDNGNQNLNKLHTVTFINFLHGLNFSDNLSVNDAVIDFNAKLFSYMTSLNIQSFAYLLGTIELLYVEISIIIKNYCDNNNIIQSHFSEHELLDYKHANDLFEISYELGITESDINNSSKLGRCMLNEIFEHLYVEFIQNKC